MIGLFIIGNIIFGGIIAIGWHFMAR
jgi:hypothetical protein